MTDQTWKRNSVKRAATHPGEAPMLTRQYRSRGRIMGVQAIPGYRACDR